MSFAGALGRGLDRMYAVAGQAATYTDRDAVVTPCTVLVDRDLQRMGEVAVVNQRTAIVAVRISEVAAPPRRAERFTLADSGQILVVDALQYSDEFEHRVYAA